MAILSHHRAFDQETPHEAADQALKQADLWGAADALELEIGHDIPADNSGMTLYISGPVHFIIDLYEKAQDIGAKDQVSHIEVDSEEDERILKHYLGEELQVLNPGRIPAQTPKAS